MSGDGPTASTSPESDEIRAVSRASAAASSERSRARFARSIACCIKSSLISLSLFGRYECLMHHRPVTGNECSLHDLVIPIDFQRLAVLVEKQGDEVEDRKSTRLNSSHVRISY